MTKLNFRDKLKKIIDSIELSDDSACGDPDCCGAPHYFISDDSTEKAVSEILKTIEGIVPKSKKIIINHPEIEAKQQSPQAIAGSLIGWNQCRTQFLKSLRGEKES